tara:strand:- start:255 stop:470 length:216 start_codon:yes stop_codon:yes gene_type:complete
MEFEGFIYCPTCDLLEYTDSFAGNEETGDWISRYVDRAHQNQKPLEPRKIEIEVTDIKVIPLEVQGEMVIG